MYKSIPSHYNQSLPEKTVYLIRNSLLNCGETQVSLDPDEKTTLNHAIKGSNGRKHEAGDVTTREFTDPHHKR